MTPMNSPPPVRAQASTPGKSRIKVLDYSGHRVLLHDFSHCDPTAMRTILEEGQRTVALEPLNSVLSLVDVTGCTFDQHSITLMKSAALANAPFVRRAALIGLSALQRMVYEAVVTFSRRNIPLFRSRKEALDWLIED
jgi:hypothetical protein